MSLDRRGFLKFAGGATVGILATPVIWKTLDDVSIWSQNWPWIPANIGGENTFVNTVSKLCPSGEAIKVRKVGTRPVRVLPNTAHPHGGGVSALGAAEVQMLYSPSRITKPLRRGADGGFSEITWEKAHALLAEALKNAKGPHKFACISGDENGTVNEVLSALTQKLDTDRYSFFTIPSEAQAQTQAWALMGGQDQAGYVIEKASAVFALGANVLESWGTVLRNRTVITHNRFNDKGVELADLTDAQANAMTEKQRDLYEAAQTLYDDLKDTADVGLYYAGALQNNTAAVADQWLPINPGTEYELGMGLANALIQAGARFNGADFTEFAVLASEYSLDKVSKITGASADSIKALATALKKEKSPLVIAGSDSMQGSGAALAMVGFALNALLGAFDTGVIKDLQLAQPVMAGALSRAEITQNNLIEWFQMLGVNKGFQPKTVLFYEANPVYALADVQVDVLLASKSVDTYKIAMTSFLDETAIQCDLVLPLAMGLERLDDVDTPMGSGKITYTVTAPVAAPIGEALEFDAIISPALKLAGISGVLSLKDAISAKRTAYSSNKKPGIAFEAEGQTVENFVFRADILGKIKTIIPAEPVRLATIYRVALGNADSGIPPFATKVIRRNELSYGKTCAVMNEATAQSLTVKQGDAIVLSNDAGTLKAVVSLSESIITGSVAVLMGMGHTAFDRFSQNKGENVLQLMKPSPEPGTVLSVWNSIGVNIAKA